jgi:hypothetical protein
MPYYAGIYGTHNGTPLVPYPFGLINS